MRIAQVIGTVTLNQRHPTFNGATLKLIVPLTLADLQTDNPRPQAEELVAWDQLGAGMGDRILLSESTEASRPFWPEIKPVDAYNAAILDHINLPKTK